MKKLIAVTIMLLMIALVGYSQNASEIKKDTSKICLERAHVITAFKKDDSLQVAKKEISLLEFTLKNTELALQKSDSVAAHWKSADEKSQAIIAGMNKEISRHEAKYDLSQVYKKALQSTVRRKNTTIRIIAGVSISVVGTLTYLLVRK